MSRTSVHLYHDINKVVINNPVVDEVLTYNGTNWVNAPIDIPPATPLVTIQVIQIDGGGVMPPK